MELLTHPATALAVYLIGLVATTVVVVRHLAREWSPLDYSDIGGALFFGLGWPILAPAMVVVHLVAKVLPLFGVEVKR